MTRVNGTTDLDFRPNRPVGANQADEGARSAETLGGRSPRRGWRLRGVDRATRELLARVGPLLLRLSLGVVFVWFGLLKVASASAVGGLVATTVPFLDSSWFVPVLGALEVAIGLAFATGRFLRAVLPVFLLHLGGTFLVLILLPGVAFEQDNPLMLTIVGEFVVKNLVLLSAGLVVASGAHAAQRKPRTPYDGEGERTKRGTWLIAGILAVFVAMLVSGCASEDSGSPAASDVSTIAVRDYEFAPGTVSVDVGETVTWVWEGEATHNVVGDGFESPDQSSGSFGHTFGQPGTYEFACTLHPGMAGEVVVERGSGNER